MDIDGHVTRIHSWFLMSLGFPGIPWVSSARQHLSLSGSSNTAAAMASPTVTYYHYHPQGTNCSPTTAATTTTSVPAKSTEPSDDIRIYQVERGQKDKQSYLCSNLVGNKQVVCEGATGRTLFLTPGTQKLPHPHGTQGYPRPNGSYPRDQILLAHWYHTIVGLANKIFKMCPCHCEPHI